MPNEKLNDLVLSLSLFSIGDANENDKGPIGVIKSRDVPIDVLRSISDDV